MLDVGAPHGWGPKRLTEDQLQVVLARLTSAAQEGGADTTLLRQGTTEVPGEGGQQLAQPRRSALGSVARAHCCNAHAEAARL